MLIFTDFFGLCRILFFSVSEYRRLPEKPGKQRHQRDADQCHTATGHELFYPQLGVKLCSMAGGGVQKIYMVFLREPSRRDRSGSDLFHLRDGFEIKMNFDRNVSCFIFVNICKNSVNEKPSPAVRRCNSFCFYGIAAAMGLRHTNGNIGVTISNIRPECFSFSLPLLQFQKRFLATSANKAFAINRPVRFSPLLRSGAGDLAKPDTKNWTRLSPCPICTSNLLIFIQS